jgi:hypothetical protein
MKIFVLFHIIIIIQINLASFIFLNLFGSLNMHVNITHDRTVLNYNIKILLKMLITIITTFRPLLGHHWRCYGLSLAQYPRPIYEPFFQHPQRYIHLNTISILHLQKTAGT